jgi:hypothetical protein
MSVAVTVGQGSAQVVFANNSPLAFIAGPCVIESEEHVLRMASAIQQAAGAFVFKASFDKANRSSVRSYRGPGLREGLRILAQVRALGIPVLTDIHEPAQAAIAAECVDVLQIPAFLCRQTDLLLEAGRTGRAVNIKKGQFVSPADFANAAEKVASTGNQRILLTERGSSFGYNNLWSICAVFASWPKPATRLSSTRPTACSSQALRGRPPVDSRSLSDPWRAPQLRSALPEFSLKCTTARSALSPTAPMRSGSTGCRSSSCVCAPSTIL